MHTFHTSGIIRTGLQCGAETPSVAKKEEQHQIKVFENEMCRKGFGKFFDQGMEKWTIRTNEKILRLTNHSGQYENQMSTMVRSNYSNGPRRGVCQIYRISIIRCTKSV